MVRDIVFQAFGGAECVWLGADNGVFTSAPATNLASSPATIVYGRFAGNDEHVDAFVYRPGHQSNGSTNDYLFQGDGSGGFTHIASPSVGGTYDVVTAVDLDSEYSD